MSYLDPASLLAELLADLAAAETIKAKLADLDLSMRLADPPCYFDCPGCGRSVRVMPSQPGLRIGHQLPLCKAWERVGIKSS